MLLAWRFLHLDAAGVRYYRRSYRTGHRGVSRPRCHHERAPPASGVVGRRERAPPPRGVRTSRRRLHAGSPAVVKVGMLNSDGSLAVPSTSPPSKRGTSAGAVPPRARNRLASPGAARGPGRPRPWAPSLRARGRRGAVGAQFDIMRKLAETKKQVEVEADAHWSP